MEEEAAGEEEEEEEAEMRVRESRKGGMEMFEECFSGKADTLLTVCVKV